MAAERWVAYCDTARPWSGHKRVARYFNLRSNGRSHAASDCFNAEKAMNVLLCMRKQPKVSCYPRSNGISRDERCSAVRQMTNAHGDLASSLPLLLSTVTAIAVLLLINQIETKFLCASSTSEFSPAWTQSRHRSLSSHIPRSMQLTLSD